MKRKTINKVINVKFDEWVESITDPAVKKLVKDNSMITGGCIASMLMNEAPNDFDVYFTNKETVKAVAEYYVQQWGDSRAYVLDGADEDAVKKARTGVAMNMTPDRIKVIFPSSGVASERSEDDEDMASVLEGVMDASTKQTDEGKPKYRPVFMSCNAITLSHKIQIVLRFYGDPETVHRHYDYVHCTNYWLSKTREVNLNQRALEAIMAKELIYIGSLYPIASMIRTRKFIKRGFSCNAGQYLKMAFQISELNLKSMEVLEDQLVGVDVAYFTMFIKAMTEHQKKEPGFILTYPYLAEVIDRIF